MKDQSLLRFVVLGEEPLAHRCVRRLIERGHQVLGLVTRNREFMAWAKDHQIAVLERSEYATWLQGKPMDVLLSITYPALIPIEVIERARVAALNYHDGPLPRYAGMNGSAWALHSGESAHAVVWHHLTRGLDEGHIAERRDIAFDPRETSLSLNMKNSTLALSSFELLLKRLEAGDTQGTPQRQDVERSVFSRHDRPDALCVIDAQDSANAIDRLARACDFGRFTNRFGMPKVVHGERALVVRDALPQANLPEDPSPAGTILQADSRGILLRAGSGAVRLERMTTLSGEPVDGPAALEALGITVGEVLGEENRAYWQALSRSVAQSEPFHVLALRAREVPSFPFANQAEAPAVEVSVDLPPRFTARFSEQREAAALGLFAVLVSAHLRTDRFTLAYTSSGHQDARVRSLLRPAVGMNVQLSADLPFAGAVAELSERKSALDERPGFLADLILRHPPLANQQDLQRGEISPLGVLSGEGVTPPPGARLSLRLSGEDLSLVSGGAIAIEQLHSLSKHMTALATSVADNPEHPLREAQLMSPTERKRQVVEWNATDRPFPDHLRIFDLFEARADEQPDSVALVCRDQTLTFRELEHRANQVAACVRAAGAGPGQYVGLVVERGLDLVVALLGIAKSGAAYLPIDTLYPADRARFMLDDCDCKVVVASSSLRDRGAGRTVLCVDGPEVAAASGERQACPAGAQDVCYAIFTSGSTGKPKGVVLTHRAVINTLDWINRVFEVTPQDRLLFVTSPSFDLSVYDVFGALGAGASVEVADASLLESPEAIVAKLTGGDITVWDSAPPALARLAPFLPDHAAEAKLRLVMLSGDYIPVGLPDHLRAVFTGVSVKSLGGATEAAIWSNYYHVGEVDPAWTSIPYGFPIQNARYYILDHHLRPVPTGTEGELFIGGVPLAQGYLNRAELTAERFLPSPFAPDERIYRTGDLARFWRDGTMEILGRSDFQVKIRGFRVETGEVQAAIAQRDCVRDALVTAYTDGSGQKALVAYVVPMEQNTLDAQAMRTELAEQLPAFMVPSHVIPLRQLPLTDNGKVDRKALPSPAEQAARSAYAAPVSAMEQQLVEIWQSVMQRERIGVDDDFFELGGHSLMAVQIVSEIKARLGQVVPLSQMLDYPTVCTFAKALDAPVAEQPKDASPKSTVTLLRAGGALHFYFIYDGDGEVLLYRNLARRLPEEFTVYGVKPRALSDMALAHTHITDMAAHAVEQVVRHQGSGPYFLGGLCAGGVIAFEMTAQLEATGNEVGALVLLDAPATQMPRRRFYAHRRRLSRVQSEIRRSREAPPPTQTMPGPTKETAAASRVHSLRRLSTVLAKKAWGGASYEAREFFAGLSTRARMAALEHALRTGSPWPERLTPLAPRQVFELARETHMPRRVACHNVILVRATSKMEGVINDEPMTELYADPLLGWGAHTTSGMTIFEVNAGHSSMLQEPHVADLARQVRRFLGFEPAETASEESPEGQVA